MFAFGCLQFLIEEDITDADVRMLKREHHEIVRLKASSLVLQIKIS